MELIDVITYNNSIHPIKNHESPKNLSTQTFTWENKKISTNCQNIPQTMFKPKKGENKIQKIGRCISFSSIY